MSKRPDVLVIGGIWPQRALLRAQLIEEGYEVSAVDAWPIPRRYRLPGTTPRVLLIDLQGLPDPRAMLNEVPLVVPRDRVVVVTALGALPGDEVRRLGFNVVERPASIGQVVAATTKLLTG